MNTLIFGHDEKFAEWAASQIPHVGPIGFGPCRAVGVATGQSPKDLLLAVCVFHDYHVAHRCCQISFVARSPFWATRGIIKALLSIPFEQYNCFKVWTAIPLENKRAERFNRGIGFKPEGTLAHHCGVGKHVTIFRMLKPDYQRMCARFDKKWSERPTLVGPSVMGAMGLVQ